VRELRARLRRGVRWLGRRDPAPARPGRAARGGNPCPDGRAQLVPAQAGPDGGRSLGAPGADGVPARLVELAGVEQLDPRRSPALRRELPGLAAALDPE